MPLERLGISQWDTAISSTKVIEHGEGGLKYSAVTGTVEMEDSRMVVFGVVTRKLPGEVVVSPRTSQSLYFLTGISCSAQVEADSDEVRRLRGEMKAEAIASVKTASALSWQIVLESHSNVWKNLWTSGFGISHSFTQRMPSTGTESTRQYTTCCLKALPCLTQPKRRPQ